VDIAFVGVDGVDAERGLTTQNEVEAATNRVLMDRAKRTVVVADATKLGRLAFAEIAGIDRAHQLITNDGGDAEQLERLRAAGLANPTALCTLCYKSTRCNLACMLWCS